MFLTDKAIVSDHEDWYSYPQNQCKKSDQQHIQKTVRGRWRQVKPRLAGCLARLTFLSRVQGKGESFPQLQQQVRRLARNNTGDCPLTIMCRYHSHVIITMKQKSIEFMKESEFSTKSCKILHYSSHLHITDHHKTIGKTSKNWNFSAIMRSHKCVFENISKVSWR